jgi:hypothetical protein
MVAWTVAIDAGGDVDIMVHARLVADTARSAWKIWGLVDARKGILMWMGAVEVRVRRRVRWVCWR